MTTVAPPDAVSTESGRARSMTLPCTPRAARAARGFVSELIYQWGWAALCEDAVEVVSELVTNALLHGKTCDAIDVRCYEDDGALWFEVDDRSSTVPTMRTTDADLTASEQGRGLLLVDELTTDWGWRCTASGKTVWAQWELP